MLAGPRAPDAPARERAHLLPAPVGRARQSRAFARAVGRRWRTARASRSAPRRCRRHVSHPTRGRPLRLFRERGRPDAVAIRDTGSRCPSETGTSPGSTSDVERVPPPIGTRRPSLGRNMFRLRVDVESVSTKSGAGDFPRVPPDSWLRRLLFPWVDPAASSDAAAPSRITRFARWEAGERRGR